MKRAPNAVLRPGQVVPTHPAPRVAQRARKAAKRKVSPWLILPFALPFVLPFAGIPWGWYPSWGQSYGETLKGLGFVHVKKDFTEDEVRIGTNVGFRAFGVSMIKRVRLKVGLWVEVEGDNSSNGGSMTSYELGWLKLPGAAGLPPDPLPPNGPKKPIEVEEVIDGMWDFHRLVRSFSSEGRMVNEVTMSFAPNKYVLAGDMAAGVAGGEIRVYHKDAGIIFRSPAHDYGSGAMRPIEYRNGRFVYKPINRGHIYAVFDPNATGSARSYTFDTMDTLPMAYDGDTLTERVVVKPGAVVRFSEPRRVTIDEEAESHSVPTALVDGTRVLAPMCTPVTAKGEVRNVGRDAFTLAPS